MMLAGAKGCVVCECGVDSAVSRVVFELWGIKWGRVKGVYFSSYAVGRTWGCLRSEWCLTWTRKVACARKLVLLVNRTLVD